MIKYIPQDTSVTFSEVPDNICLCLNLSCCPHRCPGCHSKYLQSDIGNELTTSTLNSILDKNNGITCVVFMGGDNDKDSLKALARFVHSKSLKTGWYSGESDLNINEYAECFDYIKVGPYIESLGPLNCTTTNQRLYSIKDDKSVEDITSKFWKHFKISNK